jgi:hypothetical protein
VALDACSDSSLFSSLDPSEQRVDLLLPARLGDPCLSQLHKELAEDDADVSVDDSGSRILEMLYGRLRGLKLNFEVEGHDLPCFRFVVNQDSFRVVSLESGLLGSWKPSSSTLHSLSLKSTDDRPSDLLDTNLLMLNPDIDIVA